MNRHLQSLIERTQSQNLDVRLLAMHHLGELLKRHQYRSQECTGDTPVFDIPDGLQALHLAEREFKAIYAQLAARALAGDLNHITFYLLGSDSSGLGLERVLAILDRHWRKLRLWSAHEALIALQRLMPDPEFVRPEQLRVIQRYRLILVLNGLRRKSRFLREPYAPHTAGELNEPWELADIRQIAMQLLEQLEGMPGKNASARPVYTAEQ